MHTYGAWHNFGDLHFDAPWPLKRLRTSSTGVGKTQMQGKTSCLCEAIERFSGVFQGNEYRKKSAYQKIKEDAIHPHSLLLFSDHQYTTRDTRNQTDFSFHFIPMPFEETKEIDWTPVWSLTEKRFKWIPTGMCYFAYPFPSPKEIFFVADSNGSAAGNTKEEAILQGFFELVERDSISLWWNSRLQCPGVDLQSFQDNYVDQLISFYASLNRRLWVLDITMDLNIPTFVAISSMVGESQESITLGFGTHFDPKVALMRALMEMNQFFFLFSHQALTDPQTPKQVAVKNWVETVTLNNSSYLVPNALLEPKRCQDYDRFDTSDIKDDILMCQKIIEKKGLEMLVLDQTRSEVGLPVVKVFVPGLRHYWNRYAPGRLYDIPVELGFIKQKLKEEELNPILMFP
jgi:ribosomal protein S12 methylthiotransferase accessory factor